MSFTAAAVRRLVFIDPAIISDSEIEAYADDGYTVAIDVAIAIADWMATQTAGSSESIKVGPITIQSAGSSQNWQAIKDNLIKRKNLGIDPGSGLGLAGLTFPGGVTLTGDFESQVSVGQFDNPPDVESDS